MLKLICPPTKLNSNALEKTVSVFLGGSIEQGTAPPWQDHVVKEIEGCFQHYLYTVTVLNPRRKQWDNSWKQSIKNKQFTEQVRWELKAQELADVIMFYFDPATKAPITLLELGLAAKTDQYKLVVCCPEGYWRKGNVDFVCEDCGIEVYDCFDLAVKEVLNKVMERKGDSDFQLTPADRRTAITKGLRYYCDSCFFPLKELPIKNAKTKKETLLCPICDNTSIYRISDDKLYHTKSFGRKGSKIMECVDAQEQPYSGD